MLPLVLLLAQLACRKVCCTACCSVAAPWLCQADDRTANSTTHHLARRAHKAPQAVHSETGGLSPACSWRVADKIPSIMMMLGVLLPLESNVSSTPSIPIAGCPTRIQAKGRDSCRPPDSPRQQASQRNSRQSRKEHLIQQSTALATGQHM